MRLVFDNITKRYKTNAALSEVSLELSEGVYAFLGPNGAGKTTLMNILCGIIAPTSGKVTLDGKDTVSMDKDFRRLLGYLPQNPGFYPSFSGLELLRYFCSLKEVNKPSARIDEVLNFVNLYDERKKKSDYPFPSPSPIYHNSQALKPLKSTAQAFNCPKYFPTNEK